MSALLLTVCTPKVTFAPNESNLTPKVIKIPTLHTTKASSAAQTDRILGSYAMS